MNTVQKNRNKFLGVVALALIVGVISYPWAGAQNHFCFMGCLFGERES